MNDGRRYQMGTLVLPQICPVQVAEDFSGEKAPCTLIAGAVQPLLSWYWSRWDKAETKLRQISFTAGHQHCSA